MSFAYGQGPVYKLVVKGKLHTSCPEEIYIVITEWMARTMSAEEMQR